MVFAPLPLSLEASLSQLSVDDRALIVRHIGPIRELEGNDEGTSVKAFRLNGGWVLRVARSSATPLARETNLLNKIAPLLPAEFRTLLPVPELVGDGWALHRHLPGQPTSRSTLAGLPPPHRARLLAELGALLKALHHLSLPADAPAADTPHTPTQWQTLMVRAEAILFPLLSTTLADDLRGHLRAATAVSLDSDRATLIHDDLHPAHILHDPNTGRLAGLLDFGRAGRGDPTVDLAGLLYNWGGALLNSLAYPGLSDHLPRARALARTYEVQWALEGIERQDMRWLLYALGAAKDF